MNNMINRRSGLYGVFILTAFLMSACNPQQVRPEKVQYAPAYPEAKHARKAPLGSIYAGQASSYIFEDHKARDVGDVLTIVLTEKTNATKKATTTTKKENTNDFGTPTIFGGDLTVNGRNLLNTDIETEQEFVGEGDSKQSNALNGTISVTVAQVYPNGNLFVRGQKRIFINQGDEYILVSGIVRPQDISPRNTVPSTLLADASITYSGTGAVADSNRMGWLARFFNSPYWPF